VHRALDRALDRRLHAVDEPLQPRLDVAARVDGRVELDLLALRAKHLEHARLVGLLFGLVWG
jgi:hypothetical protein